MLHRAEACLNGAHARLEGRRNVAGLDCKPEQVKTLVASVGLPSSKGQAAGNSELLLASGGRARQIAAKLC